MPPSNKIHRTEQTHRTEQIAESSSLSTVISAEASAPANPASGAAMDVRIAPPTRWRAILRRWPWGVALALLFAVCWLLLQSWPQGLSVARRDVQIAQVERAVFRDELVLHASLEPMQSVLLDAVESGRVEEVLVRDGDIVKQGQILFRLANPQRNLELLARQGEQAQQLSNLANLRLMQQSSESEHKRRLLALQFTASQAHKQWLRKHELAQRGFVASAVLEEAQDAAQHAASAVQNEKESFRQELQVKVEALAQLEKSFIGLQKGMTLVQQTVDALVVRAPVAGRVTGLRLQVGESVRLSQNLGRIDEPRQFKVLAQVDEFYLNRIAAGQRAEMQIQGIRYALQLNHILPQIKDGRFSIELTMAAGDQAASAPNLKAGQSVEVHLTLGAASQALLLPNAAFATSVGSEKAALFVLSADGKQAQRRVVTLGRRNRAQIEVLAGLAAGEKVIISSYAAWAKVEQLQLK